MAEGFSSLFKLYELLKDQCIELPVVQELIFQLNKRGWELSTSIRTPEEASKEIAKKLDVKGET